MTITLIAVGLLALALSGYLTPLTRLVTNPFTQLQTWFSERYVAAHDYFTAPSDTIALRQRNVELEAQIAQLEAQIISMQQQLSQMDVLTALLNFSRAQPENRYIAASVIGQDPSPFLHYIIINRGSDDGLRRGMPVVSPKGLIGRISAVTAGASRVQLITDPGTYINVYTQPSQAEAVLRGSITGEISLDMIPQEAQVNVGDVVLTSGLGGNFPPNLLIGQITSVRKLELELFQLAAVQPTTDFTKLTIVLVIINFNPVDITPLIPTTTP
ncbi:MAG: rod shape-determining protein MreC [Chloroflexota bacterium]